MKDIGLKIYKIIQDLKNGKMVLYIRENISMAKKMELGLIYGLMEINMKESF